MNYNWCRKTIIAATLLLPIFLVAQTDSSELRKIELLRNKYDTEIKNPNGFLSGVIYSKQYPNFESTPFYGSGNWQACQLFSGGEKYNHKFIKYDMYDDVLVALLFTPEGPKYIQLNKEINSKFILDGKTFNYISFSKVGDKHVYPKYLETLIDGKTTLYKSWQKKKIKATENSYGNFEEFYRYIILHKGVAYDVSSQKRLVKVLANSNPDIEKFITSKNLEFEKYFEEDLKQVIHHINNK